jgi:thiamine-phosphate pyrophosphorylase
VTDRHATGGRPLVDVVTACLAAGLPAVQVREKDLGAGELHALARALRERTRSTGARLLVNDRVDVALAVRADGVHLPVAGLPPAVARTLLRPGTLLGCSTHSAEEARRAAEAGADYVVFGPIYDTPSKRVYGPPRGLETLATLAGQVGCPVIAIGGVTADRLPELREAGAAGVAVIRALLAAPDPSRATGKILAACREAWS